MRENQALRAPGDTPALPVGPQHLLPAAGCQVSGAVRLGTRSSGHALKTGLRPGKDGGTARYLQLQQVSTQRGHLVMRMQQFAADSATDRSLASMVPTGYAWDVAQAPLPAGLRVQWQSGSFWTSAISCP